MHYVLNHVKSEFMFIAMKPIQAYAMTKRFIHNNIFPKYPEIE